jgi:hypothetical protein
MWFSAEQSDYEASLASSNRNQKYIWFLFFWLPAYEHYAEVS